MYPGSSVGAYRAPQLDERYQLALSRYYLDSGARGLAVGVHSTQFEIRELGLYPPVLELSMEAVANHDQPTVMIAGVCGDTRQAVSEASVAADLGYHAALVAPRGFEGTEEQLVDHYRTVAEVLPVIGFYLQTAVGGRVLSTGFWESLLTIPEVVGIKVAAFDRGQSEAVFTAFRNSQRNDVALYTGNDNMIVDDLLTPSPEAGGRRYAGGLLGHWAIWTSRASRLLEECKFAADNEENEDALFARGRRITEMNAAVFDYANSFRGCLSGISYVLWKQGLMRSHHCLSHSERLSPGQAELIDHVRERYPEETDDHYVADNLAKWLS